MIQLYYSPGTACLAPHFLLEELGIPYELILVDIRIQEHHQESYLKLNPQGKIPFMVDGDFQLSESAAICLHLADRYAQQTGQLHFSPALSSHDRAHLLQWMFYLSNTLQAEMMSYFYPERLTEDATGAAQIKDKAEERVAKMLNYIDDKLAASGGNFLLSDKLSIADLFCFMLCRWTRGMHKPARVYPHLGPYLDRLFARPAIPKVFEMEELQAPYY